MARNLGALACRVKSFGGKARAARPSGRGRKRNRPPFLAGGEAPKRKRPPFLAPGAKPPKRKRPPFLGGRIEKLFGLFVSRTVGFGAQPAACRFTDRKSTRLNSSH